MKSAGECVGEVRAYLWASRVREGGDRRVANRCHVTITRFASERNSTRAIGAAEKTVISLSLEATRRRAGARRVVCRDVSHACVAAVLLRAHRGVPGVDVEALRGRGLGRGRGRGGRSRTSRPGKGDLARLGQVRFRRAQRAVPVQRRDLSRRGREGEDILGSAGDARANEKGQGVVAPSGSRRKGSSRQEICFFSARGDCSLR